MKTALVLSLVLLSRLSFAAAGEEVLKNVMLDVSYFEGDEKPSSATNILPKRAEMFLNLEVKLKEIEKDSKEHCPAPMGAAHKYYGTVIRSSTEPRIKVEMRICKFEYSGPDKRIQAMRYEIVTLINGQEISNVGAKDNLDNLMHIVSIGAPSDEDGKTIVPRLTMNILAPPPGPPAR